MNLISKLVPTPKSIQKEYVEKRQRALYKNDDDKTKRVQAIIEGMMQRGGIHNGDWHAVYLKIHASLQNSALTINFDAWK